jgi:DNA processing protein
MSSGQQALFGGSESAPAKTISPLLEMGAYEALWSEPGASFRRIAERLRSRPDALLSDFVPHPRAMDTARRAVDILRQREVRIFGVQIHRAGEYPRKLRDAQNPLELLYYQGWWGLVERRSVAVVGTRKPSSEGKLRTRKLVCQLVEDGWTIVSGLAAGIDTEAHRTALAAQGQTIAVIGTPLSETYPKDNRDLQAELAENHLVLSQIPILRYYQQSWKLNRHFFPERNITMSALTEATIIVEAGNTSGTLIQARAALQQKRKLFILDSCFQNPELTWPARFEQLGAIRVMGFDEIRSVLGIAQQDR